MNKRILLEVLEDKRVQKLLNMALKIKEQCGCDDVITALKKELGHKERGQSPYNQSELFQ